MHRKFSTLLILVLTGIVWLCGDDFKPYDQWSRQEARKLLTDSSWARCCSWQRPQYYRSADRFSECLEVYIQLFSSHPIRQALAVVAADGDSARLEGWRDFVTRDFEDEIVISCVAECETKGSSVKSEFDLMLNKLSLAELKQNTYLVTDSGDRVVIKDYLPPTPDGSGAKFIFPRHLEDGTPLVDEGARRITFQTQSFSMSLKDAAPGTNCKAMVEIAPTRDAVRQMRAEALTTFSINTSFRLDKLMYRGKFDY